jgi:hypothetical protein
MKVDVAEKLVAEARMCDIENAGILRGIGNEYTTQLLVLPCNVQASLDHIAPSSPLLMFY